MSIIQSIRERGALISAIIIALALLGFILMDAFTSRSNLFSGGNSTTLGVINGKEVDYMDFERKVKTQEEIMQAQGQEIGDLGRQRIIEGLWEQEVNQAILSSQFDKLGMEVSQKELGDILFGANPPDDLRQRFTNEQGMYDAAQAQAAMNQMRRSKDRQQQAQLSSYLESVKFNRMQEKYNSLLVNTIYYPKWLIEKQNAEASQLASISFVRYPYMMIPDSTITVSDKEIRDFMEKRKDQFEQEEESRSIAYVAFDAAPTAADSAANRAQLENLKAEFAATEDAGAFIARFGSNTPYNEQYLKEVTSSQPDSVKGLQLGQVTGPYLDGTNYVLAKMTGKKNIPDSARVRHILIKVADAQNGQIREDSAAKRTADSIQQAIAGGADFNALLQKYTEDDGSRNTGGEYTVYPGSQFVQQFYETALYEPVGTKKVVKGESGNYIGYHYMEVMSQTGFGPAYQVAYLSKPIYASDETEQNAQNRANAFAGESRDLKSFDANFEKNLKAQGVQKLYAQNIGPNDYFVPGMNSQSRAFVRSIYDADKGEVLQPERVGDKYIVAVVTDIVEEGMQPVSVARPSVEPVLRNKKKAEKIKKDMGTINSLEAVATKFNLTVEQSDSVRFIGASPGIGFEPRVVGASFNPANAGKVVPQPIEGQSGVYALQVRSVSATPVPAGSVEDQQRMMEMQARQRAMGMSEYGGQQSPPYMMVLRKVSKIKDKRSRFY